MPSTLRYKSLEMAKATSFIFGNVIAQSSVGIRRLSKLHLLCIIRKFVMLCIYVSYSYTNPHLISCALSSILFHSMEVRQNVLNDALKLTKACNYKNAGTVEFLIDDQGRHYFMEVK